MNLRRFLAILISALCLSLASCETIDSYKIARDNMNESALRIHNIFNGTRLMEIEPYLPARIIFELSYYNKEMDAAIAATHETLIKLEISPPTKDVADGLKSFYHYEDFEALQTQFTEVAQAANEMRNICKRNYPELIASCQKLSIVTPLLEKNTELHLTQYSRVLKIIK